MSIREPIIRRGKGPKPSLLCGLCGDPVKVDGGAAVIATRPTIVEVGGVLKPAKFRLGFVRYECNGCN